MRSIPAFLLALPVLLATSAGAARWQPAPIPAGASGHEHAIHYLLDAAGAGVPSTELRRFWRQHARTVERLCRSVEGWSAKSSGSWNHGPNSCAAWLVVTGDAEPARILEGYARSQLREPPDGHGLMGRETLSHRYLDTTLVALELAAARSDRPATRTALHRLLRAHAYALTLFAIERGPSGERLSIVAPGARSKTGTTEAPWLSRWLAGALYGGERPTLGWKRQWAWPLRVSWTLDKPWLSPADRALLRRHVATGGEAAAIVATLQELGAAFVVDVDVVRTPSGLAAWMARNPNGNTAPLMGASWTGGRLHALHLHPQPEDAGGGRDLGTCRADLEGRSIAASCVGAVGFRAPPPKGVRYAAAKSTYSATIPLPPGPELYRVRIGPDGAELLAAGVPAKARSAR